MTSLLIAKTSSLARRGIAAQVEGTDYSIAGSVGSGALVLDEVHANQPDIVLLDSRLEDVSGFELHRRLRDSGDQRPVVLIAEKGDSVRIWEALQRGANGILSYQNASEKLLECLDAVRAGERWVEQSLVSSVFSTGISRQGDCTAALAMITPKEFQVIRGLQQGLRNKEIAAQLGISENTVKTHLNSIYEKLNVSSRAQLILYAQKYGCPEPGIRLKG